LTVPERYPLACLVQKLGKEIKVNVRRRGDGLLYSYGVISRRGGTRRAQWQKSKRLRVAAGEEVKAAHAVAVALAPETPRPIREGARRILRAIREREQGRESG